MAVKKVKSEKLKVKSASKKEKVVKKVLKVKKTVEKKAAVKTKAVKTVEKKVVNFGLTIDVLNTAGKALGKISLPKDIFGAKVNKNLLAQAVRVYLVNQRQGDATTKTRGEVEGSTRKIYRQKGTGRARHGGVRAPIFVKGGIAHGPKKKEYALSLPKKMKKMAFISALSSKAISGQIKVVSGLEKLEKKTKFFAKAFSSWGFSEKNRNALIVLPKDMKDVQRSIRNLAGVSIATAENVNTYEVLKHNAIIFLKETIDALEGKYKNKKS